MKVVKSFFIKADNFIGRVADWAAVVSGILIVLMGILTTYGVGRRYAFGAPEPYSYELSVIFLVACILLAIPAVQRHKRNLRVDAIVGRLSPKWQNIFENIIVPLVALVFVVIVVWKGWESFTSSYAKGETSQSVWQEPLWPMKLLVPLTMGWLALVLISQLVHGVQHLVRGTLPEDKRIDLGEVTVSAGAAAVAGDAVPAATGAAVKAVSKAEATAEGDERQ